MESLGKGHGGKRLNDALYERSCLVVGGQLRYAFVKRRNDCGQPDSRWFRKALSNALDSL